MNLLAITLIDWFVKFPALWAAAGFLIGGLITAIAAVLIFRKFGDGLIGASNKMVELQKDQLEVMERTMRFQKDHLEEEIKGVKKEWQECRTTLHAKREEWQSESTRMQLLIQDLESRPDMRVLNSTLQNVVELIQKVADNLEKHDQSIDERMRRFVEILKPKRKTE